VTSEPRHLKLIGKPEDVADVVAFLASTQPAGSGGEHSGGCWIEIKALGILRSKLEEIKDECED